MLLQPISVFENPNPIVHFDLTNSNHSSVQLSGFSHNAIICTRLQPHNPLVTISAEKQGDSHVRHRGVRQPRLHRHHDLGHEHARAREERRHHEDRVQGVPGRVHSVLHDGLHRRHAHTGRHDGHMKPAPRLFTRAGEEILWTHGTFWSLWSNFVLYFKRDDEHERQSGSYDGQVNMQCDRFELIVKEIWVQSKCNCVTVSVDLKIELKINKRTL